MQETKSTMAVCSAFLPAVYCVDQFITSSPLEPSPLVNPVPVITGICENEGVYTFLRKYISISVINTLTLLSQSSILKYSTFYDVYVHDITIVSCFFFL